MVILSARLIYACCWLNYPAIDFQQLCLIYSLISCDKVGYEVKPNSRRRDMIRAGVADNVTHDDEACLMLSISWGAVGYI
jgi:hypothetical protein